MPMKPLTIIIETFLTKPISFLFFPVFLVLNLLTRIAPLGLVVGLVISIAPYFNESLAQTAKNIGKQHPDDLTMIITETFGNSLEMVIARETEIYARETKRQAFYKLFPQLSLVAAQKDYDSTRIDGTETTTNTAQQTTSQTIKLSQTLLGSGAPSYRYSAGKADHNIAIQQLKQNENNILLNIIRSYSNLYTAQKIKEIADTNLNRLQQHYNATKQRQSFGSASVTELKQAEAQLETARANAIRANGDMLATQASFEALTDITVTGMLVEPTIINQAQLPTSLQDALTQAETYSPDVKIALQEQKKSKALRLRSGLPLIPNISVEAGTTEIESPSNILDNGQATSEESFVTFQLSYNITPGQALSARRQATSNNRARNAGLLLARRNLRSNTIVAWQNYTAAKAVLGANKLARNASESAFEGTQAEYDLNRRSQLELLDAQETLLNAEQAYYQAYGNLINSHYQLLANGGKLGYADFKS